MKCRREKKKEIVLNEPFIYQPFIFIFQMGITGFGRLNFFFFVILVGSSISAILDLRYQTNLLLLYSCYDALHMADTTSTFASVHGIQNLLCIEFIKYDEMQKYEIINVHPNLEGTLFQIRHQKSKIWPASTDFAWWRKKYHFNNASSFSLVYKFGIRALLHHDQLA